MILRNRIKELLAQGPCSAEYIADVTRQPVDTVRRELDKLQRGGHLKIKTIYCEVPRMTDEERRIEAKLIGLPPAYQAAIGKVV